MAEDAYLSRDVLAIPVGLVVSSVVFEGLVPFDLRQGLEKPSMLHFVKSRLPRGWTLPQLQERNMVAALELLKEMKAQGLPITTPVMNAALKVYAEALR